MEPAVEQDLMEFSNMMKDLLAFPRQDLDVLEGCASHQVVKENSSQEGDQDKFENQTYLWMIYLNIFFIKRIRHW